MRRFRPLILPVLLLVGIAPHAAEIGGLPSSKLHSAALVIDALRRAIASYQTAKG